MTEDKWRLEARVTRRTNKLLKVLAQYLYNEHESDWMQSAACQVEFPETGTANLSPGEYEDAVSDTSFIHRPTEEETAQWERVCKKCPVSMECMEWADENEVTGVFVAGEWRE